MKKEPEIIRRYRTDYAGAFPGNCRSRETAILAAMLHVVRDGYTRATITDRVTGETVARVRLSDDRKRAIVDVVNPLRKIGRP